MAGGRTALLHLDNRFSRPADPLRSGKNAGGDFWFSAVEYSYIVLGFLIATGLGYLFAGGMIDRFGVRTSFAVALTVWSVAAVAHSLAKGWISFLVLRVVLGLGESFYTPAAARVLRDWIP